MDNIFSEFIACPKCFVIESLNDDERSQSSFKCLNCQHIITFNEAKELGLVFEDIDYNIDMIPYCTKLAELQQTTTDLLLKAKIEIELRLRFQYKLGQYDALLGGEFEFTSEDDSHKGNN